MTYLDWFIMIAVAGGLVRGLMVGAIRQVASIVGLVLSFILAVQLMRPIGDMTVESMGVSQSTAPLVGFVVVFAGVQLLVVALARTLEAVVESLHLSFANRAAGGALGAFKAALILSVLFLVTTHAGIPDQKTQGNSVLYSPVANVLPGTWDYVAAYLPAVRQASDAFGRDVRPRLTPSAPDETKEDAAPRTVEPDSFGRGTWCQYRYDRSLFIQSTAPVDRQRRPGSCRLAAGRNRLHGHGMGRTAFPRRVRAR